MMAGLWSLFLWVETVHRPEDNSIYWPLLLWLFFLLLLFPLSRVPFAWQLCIQPYLTTIITIQPERCSLFLMNITKIYWIRALWVDFIEKLYPSSWRIWFWLTGFHAAENNDSVLSIISCLVLVDLYLTLVTSGWFAKVCGWDCPFCANI